MDRFRPVGCPLLRFDHPVRKQVLHGDSRLQAAGLQPRGGGKEYPPPSTLTGQIGHDPTSGATHLAVVEADVPAMQRAGDAVP